MSRTGKSRRSRWFWILATGAVLFGLMALLGIPSLKSAFMIEDLRQRENDVLTDWPNWLPTFLPRASTKLFDIDLFERAYTLDVGVQFFEADLVSLPTIGQDVGWLEFNTCPIPAEAWHRFPSMPSVETLWFSDCTVTDETLPHILAQVPKLDHIMLQRCLVTNDGLAHLHAATNLTVAYIRDPEITEAGLEHLVRLPHLRRLDVQDTAIGDSAIPMLTNLTGLTELDIEGAKFSSNGMERLEKAMPSTSLLK